MLTFCSTKSEAYGPQDVTHLRAREHTSQLVPVTKTMTESSAMLTFCSTKSEAYGPQDVAHFARKRAQESVGPRDNDRDRIISDSYALQHQE
jgi:hypothetical protein